MLGHIVDEIADQPLLGPDALVRMQVGGHFQLHPRLREVRLGVGVGPVAEPALLDDRPHRALPRRQAARAVDVFQRDADRLLRAPQDVRRCPISRALHILTTFCEITT